MKLTYSGIENEQEWLDKNFEMPAFDIARIAENTKSNPQWIHFGAGNIFRAFQANRVQDMLDKGEMDTGLIVAEGFDYDIIKMMNEPHDNLSILVTLKADGNLQKRVVASIMESYVLDSQDTASFNKLKEIFANPSLQMASFTITEKGYQLVNGKGELMAAVVEDFNNGPASPCSYIGKVAALMHFRSVNCDKPMAMVSMDNCSHNGDKLKAAVLEFAKEWAARGFVEADFVESIEKETSFTFPWSMIDKITPRPDESIQKLLEEDMVEDVKPVITSKNTYIASYVNSEECEYLVIEDNFPNGRPALEKAGFIFTDRDTVEKVERMKVCTCLNPLHTALAVSGCLLGYTKISEEMKDADLKKMVMEIGYKEGLPVVENPGVLDPGEFIDSVVNSRIPNPYLPDTPQRIATDTSQKLSIRFGETVKKYMSNPDKDINDLKMIPLVYALWLRYLMGIDDKGQKFELSSDPMLVDLVPVMAKIDFGTIVTTDDLKVILTNQKIFGVDLLECGLSDKVLDYFNELNAGVDAVRTTLHKYCNV